MLALNEQGITVQNYNQLSCLELGEENVFQVLDMQKERATLTRDEIRNQFAMCFFGDKGELEQCDFNDWEASIILQLWHGDLLDGVFAYADGQKVGKLALWKSNACESDILIEQHIIGERWSLYVRDTAMLEDAMQLLSTDKAVLKKEWGATFKPFKVVDGKEVEM
jgi:hypothetical protein